MKSQSISGKKDVNEEEVEEKCEVENFDEKKEKTYVNLVNGLIESVTQSNIFWWH